MSSIFMISKNYIKSKLTGVVNEISYAKCKTGTDQIVTVHITTAKMIGDTGIQVVLPIPWTNIGSGFVKSIEIYTSGNVLIGKQDNMKLQSPNGETVVYMIKIDALQLANNNDSTGKYDSVEE